jgi:hypothetical protein
VGKWFRLSALGVGVALVAGLTAFPVSAGEPPIIKIAKQKDGPYSTYVEFNIGSGQSRDFFSKARTASGAEPQKVTLELEAPPNYKVKYFKGDENITQAVTSVEGLDLTLKETPKRFRGVIKDSGNAPDPACLFANVEDPETEINIAVSGAGINNDCS